MSPVFLAALTLGFVAPADQTDRHAADSPPASRTGMELVRAFNATMRRYAGAEEDEAPAAARAMLRLYEELRRDTELAESRKKTMGVRLRARLAQLADTMEKDNRNGKAPASVDLRDRQTAMGQIGGGFGGGNRFGGGFGGAGFQGGFGAGNVLGNPNDDHGPELVDLIQKTIAPASWDVMGGRGSIYYWRPGRAIVVRQTDEVHGQLNGMLRQLERAGR